MASYVMYDSWQFSYKITIPTLLQDDKLISGNTGQDLQQVLFNTPPLPSPLSADVIQKD